MAQGSTHSEQIVQGVIKGMMKRALNTVPVLLATMTGEARDEHEMNHDDWHFIER
jgi:hypothetical protein